MIGAWDKYGIKVQRYTHIGRLATSSVGTGKTFRMAPLTWVGTLGTFYSSQEGPQKKLGNL